MIYALKNMNVSKLSFKVKKRMLLHNVGVEFVFLIIQAYLKRLTKIFHIQMNFISFQDVTECFTPFENKI